MAVENVICLILKADAPETFTATHAIHRKSGIGTIIATQTKSQAMAVHAINALVTELGSVNIKAVIAIFRLPYNVAVIAILIAHIPENKIAIPAFP